jgi:hypothetical protein
LAGVFSERIFFDILFVAVIDEVGLDAELLFGTVESRIRAGRSRKVIA